MIRTRQNMSGTLAPISPACPLQLDFFQPGSLEARMEGIVHQKTAPYAIVAQVSEGAYAVRSSGHLETLRPGDAVYIPANTTVEFSHHDGKRGRMRSHWLHFRFSYHGVLDFLSFFEVPLRLPRRVCHEVGTLISQALELPGDPTSSPGDLALQYLLASRMLQLVCRVSRRKEGALPSFEKQRLFPVLGFIRENLNSAISVELLAHVAALSPARLHAVFKNEFGCSPMRCVKTMRVEAAARLLATADFKLDAIAAMSGFADAFHLSHAFKTHFGMPPKVYRRQAANWEYK
ncbi:MAG: AraC family transcriptional regulator [Verrucomicrobiota bacterium]